VIELARSRREAGEPGHEVPPGVQDLVRARLAGLDDRTVALLRAGAVAGSRFDLDVVAAVAGLDGAALLDAVDAALASGLVVEDAPDRYRFPHDIVRRSLVAHLSSARRRSLHARAADALGRLRADDLDAHAALLAHHSAAGAAPGGDVRAVRWARRASRLAIRGSAPAEAVRLCRQALAHVPPGDDRLRAAATVDLRPALLAAGDPAAAATLLEGVDLARRHGDPGVAGRAALALADATDQRPDLRDAARSAVEAAVAVTSGPPVDAVLHARLLVRRLRLSGRAGPGGEPPPRRALQALHDDLAGLRGARSLDERMRLADELRALPAAAGDPAFGIRAAHERAMAAATLGDAAALRVSLATVAALTTEHGDAFGAAMLAEHAVARATLEGRFGDAQA